MHKKYNKFLIVSSVIVLVLGVYSYFYNDLRSEAASTEEDGALTSSLAVPTSVAPTSQVSMKATEDTAFLMKLASLKIIKIDTSIFTDQSFKILKDNKINLTPEVYGRVNPFAPTSIRPALNNNAPTFLLKTVAPSAITNKSAVLNGSLENATSTNIYFEYGTTPTLGKVTAKVIPSLIGNFASNLTGLTPKTTYFFRGAANVNGTLTFGEIISFNTN